jgi:hypothetical protein
MRDGNLFHVCSPLIKFPVSLSSVLSEWPLAITAVKYAITKVRRCLGDAAGNPFKAAMKV